ncbi:MAG: hypothetical protein Q9201_001977, partial [Fulgogasparrea decipioides]
MTPQPSSYSPTLPINTISLFLFLPTALTFTLDQPTTNNNDVTWLYPIPPSTPQGILTYNTLDTLNVSWISTHAPTYLTLACYTQTQSQSQNKSAYASTLQIAAPATGNRLISLNYAKGFTRCRFEISTPANTSTVSHSHTFDLLDQEDKDPVLWTLESSAPAAQRTNDSTSCPSSTPHGHNQRDKYKM